MTSCERSQWKRISIHALREEGDSTTQRKLSCLVCISIHALREEGDNLLGYHTEYNYKFQSTPSARRATEPPPDRG